MNNFNLFPSAYKEEMEKQKHTQISNVQSQASQSNTRASNSRMSKSLNGKAVGICTGIGAVVGIGSICSACSTCNNTLATGSGIGRADTATCQFMGGIGTFFLALLIGAAVGGIIELLIVIIQKANDKSIDNSIQRNNTNAANQKEQINNQYEQLYQSYEYQFENEAKRQSVKYAESQLAKEVIAWMTNGFCAAIDAFDRRPHVQKIDVPFMFNVYYNKITCNIGTYDFELKRCANLPSALDQAALNRAIAAAIQVNIMMKYPQDVTGTSVNVTTTYSYTKDSAVATLRYEAFNGNYKEVHNW